MKKTVLAVLLMVGLVFIANTQQAWAIVILDFNMDATHPAGATINYDGLGGPLSGSNISVDTITYIGSVPKPDLTINNGLLSFQSGPLDHYDSTSWYFTSGVNF